jgi:hypothetical protein
LHQLLHQPQTPPSSPFRHHHRGAPSFVAEESQVVRVLGVISKDLARVSWSERWSHISCGTKNKW